MTWAPFTNSRQAAEKGLAARRRPTAAREAYSLYVERAAAGANEADGPLSAACGLVLVEHELGGDSPLLSLRRLLGGDGAEANPLNPG